MSNIRSYLWLLFVSLTLVPASPAKAAQCVDGQQSSGAAYRICLPEGWQVGDDLVIYAHGYVSPTEPEGVIPETQMKLPDGTLIADVITALDYAFATTSYSTNGLAVPEGVADLVDVVNIFETMMGQPDTIYLTGISEGGIIAALSIEQYPDVFDGGLALCGPYGDFHEQINYFGDFRVVFDYLFPGLMPNDDPTNIPPSLIENWDSHYNTEIKPKIEDPQNAALVDQLLSITGAPYDAGDPSTKEQTIADVLWYNVFATNDAVLKLGGQPFHNQDRIYVNPDDPLDQNVPRFSADAAALDKITAQYQTSGQLGRPLVTLHTTGDSVIPYWHVARYRDKINAANRLDRYDHFEIDRYGHCSFSSFEIITAFNRLVEMVEEQADNQIFLPLIVNVS